MESSCLADRQTANGRIEWIDTAKGLGMLLVIFAHLHVGNLGTWIYTFHMPLFFFLSGYVFSNRCTFPVFLKKRVRGILVPYFSLGMVMVVFHFLWWYNPESNSYKTPFVYLLTLIWQLVKQQRFWTLWYIACLFGLNLVFYGLVSLSRKIIPSRDTAANVLLGVFVMILLVLGLTYYYLGGQPLFWNIDTILPASLFFYGGFLLRGYYHKLAASHCFQGAASVTLFLALLAVNLIAGWWGIRLAPGHAGLEMYNSTYGFPPLTLLAAFAGIGCMVILAHWGTESGHGRSIRYIDRGIRYIGRNSLIYYAWHQTIMIPLARAILALAGIHYADYPEMDLSLTQLLHGQAQIYLSFLGERILELIVILILCTACHVIISSTGLKFMIGK